MIVRFPALAALLVVASPLAARAATAAKDLDCNLLVPPGLVARVFPGGTMKPGMGDARTALCNVSLKGNDYAAQASFLCRPTDTLAEYQQKAAGVKKPALAGIGRAAVGDDRRVLFYDDDADCIVEASDNSGGKKAVDFAKELASTLKPGLLPALAAGSLSLPCPRLLPPELVKKWVPGAALKSRFVQANQMECTLEGSPGPVIVSYTCKAPITPGYWADYRKQMVQSKAADVADATIRKGGVYAAVQGMPTVAFADGETGCLVSVMAIGFDRTRALGLAADVEKALTPDSAR
jgi:hypothetical protein